MATTEERNEIIRDLAKRVKLYGIPGLSSAEAPADQEEIVTNWILSQALVEDRGNRSMKPPMPSYPGHPDDWTDEQWAEYRKWQKKWGDR